MSEEQAKYLGETPEHAEYQIRDESPHDYFCQIPNLVDELDLTPQAYRLYGHLKRVAGESGKCWQSTKTLSDKCRMSAGAVSEAKKELENTYPPLIRITSKTKENGIYHEIVVTDIWQINHDFWTGEAVHIVKTPRKRSYCENPRSQCETKNNPLIQEEPNGDAFFPEPTPTKKQGDLVDGLLALAQSPGIKRQARIDAILSATAEKLHVRTTGKRWEEFAKLADDRQQNYGESLITFLDWLTAQKGFNPQFWPPNRMAEFWPQAFVGEAKKVTGRSTPEIK